MADTKRLYRLSGNLSRNEEGGRKIYHSGDTVRLTPSYAKQIGATLVDVGGGESVEDVSVKAKIVSNKSSDDSKSSPASANTDTDWSTLSSLSYEDAVALVNSATSTNQLKEAREAEMGTGGKKRRSVIEAISAKEKELTGADSK